MPGTKHILKGIIKVKLSHGWDLSEKLLICSCGNYLNLKFNRSNTSHLGETRELTPKSWSN